MTHRNIGRITGAAALTAILALTAPAQAVGWKVPETGSASWLEATLQWIEGIWPSEAHETLSERKVGTDSSTPTLAAPAQPVRTDSGVGIDPDG